MSTMLLVELSTSWTIWTRGSRYNAGLYSRCVADEGYGWKSTKDGDATHINRGYESAEQANQEDEFFTN